MNALNKMYNVLITGGAGYIGSILIFKLKKYYPKIKITVLDNLKNCDNSLVLRNIFSDIEFKIGEISDIEEIIVDNSYETIVHLGANAYVGESIDLPEKYFGQNVSSTYAVANFAKRTKPKHLLFSSTCAVYGSQHGELSEQSSIMPDSPYGYSKVFSENILKDLLTDETKLTIFRFFNVAGAIPAFEGGENHFLETHLIPVVVRKILKNEEISIFGKDYDTQDGTCEREYVHVEDIANAHLLALSKEIGGTYNLGTSKPISNLKVLKTVEKILKKPAKFKFSDRRPGDAEKLYSNYNQAKAMLGWSPINSNIENIIKTYVAWLEKYGMEL